ncbi:MAG: GNAT family N-acetyltransferase [Candidatus Marinamargulisbacteria bacterium]
MDVIFDHWQGENLSDVIQSIAMFRKQVLSNVSYFQTQSLSNEINALQHYFDAESVVIVANDGGHIVGYISLVNELETHSNLGEYAYYGPDLMVSEGPIVHSDYCGQGIAKGLITEAIQVCQDRCVEALIFDPSGIRTDELDPVIQAISASFGFEKRLNKATNECYYQRILSDE